MKSLVFGISPTSEQENQLLWFQMGWSSDFRRCVNHPELMSSSTFVETLNTKSNKQLSYLQSEVDKFLKIQTANKKQIQDHIKKLEELKTPSQYDLKRLARLRRSLIAAPVFGNRDEFIKLSKKDENGKTLGDIEKWRKSRLRALVFYGDANRYGNRFFHFQEITEGKIVFKPEGTKIKILLTINTKKHEKDLKKLQELVLDKKIPVTVKLTSKTITIQFEEAILAESYLDIKAFYKEIKDVKDKTERKKLIREKHKEHEVKICQGKLERLMALDLNPDGIGWSVMEKDMTLIAKGYFDISQVLDAKKRAHETSIIIKKIFLLMHHYRCHSIATEELSIENKDHGNKVSNRKINNLWNRLLIVQLITRRCREEWFIHISVDCAYSTFVGNMLNNEYDPIAASIEVGRRGWTRYLPKENRESKDEYFPEIYVDPQLCQGMQEKMGQCKSWKEMHRLFVTAKRSYRRELKEFNFASSCVESKKSGVTRLHFFEFSSKE